MDFVFELLVQLVLEVIGEALLEAGWHAGKQVFTSAWGRGVVGGLVGFGFGLFWGDHLSGGAHHPKLLWVSIALAVLSAVGLLSGGVPRRPGEGVLGYVLAPPWRWPLERYWGFLLLNVGLAAGIYLSWEPALR